jgi:hypothetical protein
MLTGPRIGYQTPNREKESNMAAGKPFGEFSFKMVGQTNTPGPAGSVLVQVNFEGTATGYGAVFSTCTFIGGGKDGTYSECASAYLDNGEVQSGIGQGTYESKGKHRWSTASIVQVSDGRRLATVGEIDLASRTFKGTLSEL